MDSSTKNELSKVTFVASAFAPAPMQFLLVVGKLLEILLGWLSLSAEIFVRFAFGERYLTLLRILLAWIAFLVFRSLYLIAGGLATLFAGGFSLTQGFDFSGFYQGTTASSIYLKFVYAFWVLSALHILAIWKRNSDGAVWHSHSFGISWLEFLPLSSWNRVIGIIPVLLVRNLLKVDDWKLYCIIEPAICYAAAIALGSIDPFLGAWFTISSITLFIKNWMLYFDMRGRLLDMTDSQIESTHLQAALRGEDKRRTGGFAVVPTPSLAKLMEVEMNANLNIGNYPLP